MRRIETTCGHRVELSHFFPRLLCIVALALLALTAESVYAGAGCACDADVDLDGSVGSPDEGCFFGLFFGGRGDCLNMDINCDGVIDACDFAALRCQLDGGGAECCDVPCGACCVGQSSDIQASQNCVQTTEVFCTTSFLGGTYEGDGAPCLPSPCDCNNNGEPDGEDIANGFSADCNDNGIPDDCEFPAPNTVGACCLTVRNLKLGIAQNGCAVLGETECGTAGGDFHGICTTCPEQNLVVVFEPGGDIFIHIIGPPIECTAPSAAGPGGCSPNSPIDPWVTLPGQCHDFGAAVPIPADFFGPGSDPFSGVACFEGDPLGPTAFGSFGNADTLIDRSADPFDRCDLPSGASRTVEIEIVALSLKSTAPITVTFPSSPSQTWNVTVDLSSVTPPLGSLTATKTHCNGGLYTSDLFVQPRFTFTEVGGTGGPLVLDTGKEGQAPIHLIQSTALPWAVDVDPLLFSASDPCSDFHAGVSDPIQTQDCGAPDPSCVTPTIRSVSKLGLSIAGLLLFAGIMLLTRRLRSTVSRTA